MQQENLDQLRQQRLNQLLQSQQNQELARQQAKLQVRQALRKLLSPQAQERLANLRLANEEMAEQIEALIVYMHQAGQLKAPLQDGDLKQLLLTINARNTRKTKITRK
ncbi:MAG: hypothetical protein J4432_05440 [DPANN group archaeon]|nr:hypothetical protein [DPANN group archaeon]